MKKAAAILTIVVDDRQPYSVKYRSEAISGVALSVMTRRAAAKAWRRRRRYQQANRYWQTSAWHGV